MVNTKIVFCPTCTKKLTLNWIESVGVFRGYCYKCHGLIYARERGQPWHNRGTKKWISITDAPTELNIPRQVRLLITNLTWSEFVALIKNVWDDLKGLVT